jgi:hypothetical protein
VGHALQASAAGAADIEGRAAAADKFTGRLSYEDRAAERRMCADCVGIRDSVAERMRGYVIAEKSLPDDRHSAADNRSKSAPPAPVSQLTISF